jgi:hypothetical protein
VTPVLVNHFARGAVPRITTKHGLLTALPLGEWECDMGARDVAPAAWLVEPGETDAAWRDYFRWAQVVAVLRSAAAAAPNDAGQGPDPDPVSGEQGQELDPVAEKDPTTEHDPVVEMDPTTEQDPTADQSASSITQDPAMVEAAVLLGLAVRAALDLVRQSRAADPPCDCPPDSVADGAACDTPPGDPPGLEIALQRNVRAITADDWLALTSRAPDTARLRGADPESVGLGVDRDAFDALADLVVAAGQLQGHGVHGRGATRNMWILKPAAMSRGRGIVVVDGCLPEIDAVISAAAVDSAIGGFGGPGTAPVVPEAAAPVVGAGNTGAGAVPAATARVPHSYVAQVYLQQPLTIEDRKFDIRQWVLVTSLNPLAVFVYDKFYVRFGAQGYEGADAGDLLKHLTNASLQKAAATNSVNDNDGDDGDGGDGDAALQRESMPCEAPQSRPSKIPGRGVPMWHSRDLEAHIQSLSPDNNDTAGPGSSTFDRIKREMTDAIVFTMRASRIDMGGGGVFAPLHLTNRFTNS